MNSRDKYEMNKESIPVKCIKDVVMHSDDRVEFTKGRVYLLNGDKAINDSGNEHIIFDFDDKEFFREYFTFNIGEPKLNYVECNEVLKKPKHYDSNKDYDIIDVCKDYSLNFNRGNILKYVVRAGKKDDELKDLKKALDYLQREIDYLENE